ncbi:MerC family mercury resistance protein [Tistlia consotensis]|nr:MerC family mercury resistance protein [Tistlia consotensis]
MAPAAAALSMLACYGTLAASALLGALGVTIALNEAVWAGAIVIFAWLTLPALWLRWRRHRLLRPLALAAVGVALISITMTVAYARAVEIVGFVFLCAGTYLDWRAAGRARRKTA